MKIYNKKTFAFGVFSAALGVLNAVTAALRGIDAAGIVLVAVLLFVGAGAMMRGHAGGDRRPGGLPSASCILAQVGGRTEKALSLAQRFVLSLQGYWPLRKRVSRF